VRSGDKTYSPNRADSGLIAGFGEISVRTRMRGGPGRTRTSNQAVMIDRIRARFQKNALRRVKFDPYARYSDLKCW
jgi:hypothetical protein